MEEPKANDYSDYTKYPVDPSAPIGPKKIYSTAEGKQDNDKTNKAQEIQTKSEKIIVTIEKEKTAQPVIAA